MLKITIFKMVQMKKKLDFSSQVYASMTFQYKITAKLFSNQMSKWWFFFQSKNEKVAARGLTHLFWNVPTSKPSEKCIFQGNPKIRHFQTKCFTLAMKPHFWPRMSSCVGGLRIHFQFYHNSRKYLKRPIN